MPGNAFQYGSIAASFGLQGVTGGKYVAFIPLPNLSVTADPTKTPTPENLIAACRAKSLATLPELTKVIEPLGIANSENPDDLPYMVLVASDSSDVSSNYAVFQQAAQITIDHVYVGKTAQDGAQMGNATSGTDTAQVIRARLDLLRAAYNADPHLGGITNRTEVSSLPMNKANQYAQAFASGAALITVLGLSVQFILVEDLPTL